MGEIFLSLGEGLKWLGLALSPALFLPLLLLALPHKYLNYFKTLPRILEQATSSALSLAMGGALIMLGAQLLVIIGRYIFEWSASWANEIIIYSFAALFLLAAASALKADDHVRVDIFREKMSVKSKAAIDLIGLYLFLFPICLLILWAAISPSFVRSWANLEGSRESDGLPIYFLFRTLIPLFAVLLINQGLVEALRACFRLRGVDTAPFERSA